jgi:nickel transport protein
MRLFSLIPALACAAALSLPAQAHNVWLEPDSGGGYVVQFGGHEGVLETFRPEKLKSVQAFDQRGRSIPVKIEPREGGVHVRPERQAAMLAVHFDNGYFSRAGDGPMVEKPMNENPGATSGVHAVKYHKTLIAWGAFAQKPLGQPFEIVPLAHQTPHAGQPLRVQALLDGKPAEGIRISHGEKGAPVTTAADGTATVTPVAGINQLLAIRRAPVAGDARTSSLSYEYLLAFPVHE